MLLAIDIGNTNTVLGVFEGEKLERSWRIKTDARSTADELAAPTRGPIGKSTVEALQSGVVYGFAGQVDGLVRRLSVALHPQDPAAVEVIATGGLATLVIEHCETVTRYEPDLTLLGLRLIYDRNV